MGGLAGRAGWAGAGRRQTARAGDRGARLLLTADVAVKALVSVLPETSIEVCQYMLFVDVQLFAVSEANLSASAFLHLHERFRIYSVQELRLDANFITDDGALALRTMLQVRSVSTDRGSASAHSIDCTAFLCRSKIVPSAC